MRYFLFILLLIFSCSNSPIIIHPENNPREGHRDVVVKVKYSPNGKYIASGGYDSDLILWDGQTGSYLRTLKGNYDKIFDIAFLFNNSDIVTANYEGNLLFWNLVTGLKHSIKLDNDFISSFDVSLSEGLIITSSWDKNLRVLKISDLSPVSKCKSGDIKIRSIRYSEKSRSIFAGTSEGYLVRWPVETCKSGNNFEARISKDAITSIDINDDLNLLVTASADASLKVFNLDTMKEISTLKGHKSPVNSVRIIQQHNKIISADKNGKIFFWDIKSHEKKIIAAHAESANSIDISPDGLYIVSGSSDKSVKLWNINKIFSAKP